ncbi:MAG: GAF domain-containing sensor histidine kinase [Desulfatiglandaceae bacterium]
MLRNLASLVKAIHQEPWAKDIETDETFWNLLSEWLEEHVFSAFLDLVVRQVDELIDIDPDLSEPRILELAMQCMVDFLGAESASVRIYDPLTEQMLSYGSYPLVDASRETFVPLEGSIAGEVTKSRKPCLVPNILDEGRYQDKEVIQGRGVHSLLAIPLEIPSFFPHERDTVGVIQIYFREMDRSFSKLEIQIADLMAKRLSFVMARKKILSMLKVNEKKEAIVKQIFKKLGRKGGIKIKEAFDRIVPELADMADVQSCALFSVTHDYNRVVLEAGYPESLGYHSIGREFPVEKEPAFEVIMSLRDYKGDSKYEIVTTSYILVVEPQKSELISESLKKFARLHNINSILYIPLSVEGEITHFMTFDAIEQRLRYRDDEIELFLFLGRELMKARKMERLDDILHDFKNPTIAIAGFARRLKVLLEKEQTEKSKDQIKKYVDIVLEETSRLQELSLSIYEVGKEQVVDLSDVLRRRFEINREAIKEQLKQDVTLKEEGLQPGLHVRCYPMHLERVFDNLLNNATKAIPLKGGFLSIRTYATDRWACAEISNTGQIAYEDRVRLLEGEGQGRGLYITNRIVRLLNGNLNIDGGRNSTTFIVRLPLEKAP